MVDRQGHIWMTTGGLVSPGKGLARFDGHSWHHLTEEQGLPSNEVYSVQEDGEGRVWIGTDEGLAMYDGHQIIVYDERSGLGEKHVLVSRVDRSGRLWVGTLAGVSRLDKQGWRTFGPEDGFPREGVFGIGEDAEGVLWFSTFHGVCRYEGGQVQVFTKADGLAHNEVFDAIEAEPGVMWFATHGGISRYDQRAKPGARWSTFNVEDGLSSNDIHSLIVDKRGHLWAGTDGGGVTRYNGTEFHALTDSDGLRSNVVLSVAQGSGDVIWIATGRGLTRFAQISDRPPVAQISAVVADERSRDTGDLGVSRASLIAIEFSGVSLKSRPGAMSYRYRLLDYETEWQLTRGNRVEYSRLPSGQYVFEVLAVDRDLEISSTPATVRIRIHPPYATIALAGGLAIALVGLIIAGRTSYRRRKERDRAQDELIETQARLVAEMNRELETARQMQMALLPKSGPSLDGITLCGVCAPANHVGGDYYNFLPQGEQGARLSIVVADVSGKGMQAATVAMRFTEMLRYESTGRSEPEAILAGLDNALRGQIPVDMFVTCAIGTLHVRDRRLVLSSAGNPEICYFAAKEGTATDIRLTGFPLGMPLSIRGAEPYQTRTLDLASGDVVVFTSDGVEDAVDSTATSYDRERLSAIVEASARRRNGADAIRDDILADVREFSGNAPQVDDLTVVVLRVD